VILEVGIYSVAANGTAPSRDALLLAARWSAQLALHCAAILFSDTIEIHASDSLDERKF